MQSNTWRCALFICALAMTSCGGSESSATSEAETTTTAEPATTAPPTTVATSEAETTTTAEPTTTTEAETTTTAEPVPVVPEAPPVGTGILTVGDEEFPFTIEKCNTEPMAGATDGSIVVFEVRGSTVVEGEPAEARLFRLASGSSSTANDSFGWGYATDRNDFETLRSEGSIFGLSDHIIVQQTDAGTVFYGPPTPFERTEGISVVDNDDPGLGSIIATC